MRPTGAEAFSSGRLPSGNADRIPDVHRVGCGVLPLSRALQAALQAVLVAVGAFEHVDFTGNASLPCGLAATALSAVDVPESAARFANFATNPLEKMHTDFSK